MVAIKGFNSRTLVGLDIQCGSLAAVERSVGDGQIKRTAYLELPVGLVVDGQPSDSDQLTAELKNFFRENGLGKRVRLGINSHRVVVRILELPEIEDSSDFDAAVRFRAADELPMQLDDAALDYQVIESFADPDGTAKCRVVLVAAPKVMVEQLLAVVRDAGLKVEGVDLSAFAVIRALCMPQQEADTTAIGYCHLGSVTSFAVAKGATCVFSRTVPNGIDQAIQNPESSVDQVVEMVADQVEASLDYFVSQQGADPVTKMLVTGKGVLVPGLVDAIALRLPGEVAIGHASASDITHELTLAYGLSLDEVAA